MNKIIDVQKISYTYSFKSDYVLHDCSLDISAGEVVSLLGPNGAGKSTLLNCIGNILTPQRGDIYIHGTNIRKMSRRDIAKCVGYVQQNQMTAFSYTVFDYVLMGRAPHIDLFNKPNDEDRAITAKALSAMAIEHLSDSYITDISGGERQQAAIARVIAQQPSVILLDEPTAHLDFGNQIRTLKIIGKLRDSGYAVIMSTHAPDHCIMLGGRVALLDKHGVLVTGTCDELLTEQRLNEVYNANVKIPYVQCVERRVCIPHS